MIAAFAKVSARFYERPPDVISACEPNAFNAAELIAKAAIMVTYDKQILKYCDTIYEMRGGQLTFAASRKMS